MSRVAVGFDVDHTIAIDNKLERIALLRLLDDVVAAGGSPLGTLDDETARIDELLACQRAGACSIDEAVRGFVRERGIGEDEQRFAVRFRAIALGLVDEIVVPFPGARATFEALRARGVAVAVLSNGWNPLQVRKAARAGFSGTVLASAELGAQKPDPRTFAALTQALGVPPERTWYVGDDPHCDVEGARAAGMHPVWMDAEGRAFPSDLAPAPLRIAALEDVLALVPQPERAA